MQAIRVLLLEDDLLTLEAYQLCLSMEGYTVKTASNVSEALEILDSWIPDVIVSDIGLPEQDGYFFIKKVRADSRLSGVHAIAITGYGSVECGGKSEYDDVLLKPLNPDQLLNRISALKTGK